MRFIVGRIARRQRSQTLIEFGLTVAAVAFVALVGFSAMSNAEGAYWGGALASTLAQPTPPTSPFPDRTTVDDPTCSPASPITVGVPVTCSTIVHNTSNPRWPQGTLDYVLDGATVLAHCNLSQIATDASACQSPAMSWTPTASNIGNHSLVVKYNPAPGFYATYSKNPLTLKIVAVNGGNLNWNVSCANNVASQANPPLVAPRVEVGHPLLCQVTLFQNGTHVVGGRRIQWSVVNGAGVDGIGMFTCETGLYDWDGTRTSALNPDTAPACTGPGGSAIPVVPSGTASFVCTTDDSGTCKVLYRHLMDSVGNALGATPTLTFTALDFPDQPPYMWAGGVQVVPTTPSLGFHNTSLSTSCVSANPLGDPHLSAPLSSISYDKFHPWRNNLLPATPALTVTGSTAVTIQCTVYVADLDPNPAADYGVLQDDPETAGNPDVGDATPPLGLVTFQYGNQAHGYVTLPAVQCSLQRVDQPAPPTWQAKGQAPFMSSCQTDPFTIDNSVDNSLRLQAIYQGENNNCGNLKLHQCPVAPMRVDVEFH